MFGGARTIAHPNWSNVVYDLLGEHPLGSFLLRIPRFSPGLYGVEWTGRWLEGSNPMRSLATWIHPKRPAHTVPNSSSSSIKLCQYCSHSAAIIKSSFQSRVDPSSSEYLPGLCLSICYSRGSAYLYILTLFTSHEGSLFSHTLQTICRIMHSGGPDATTIFPL